MEAYQVGAERKAGAAVVVISTGHGVSHDEDDAGELRQVVNTGTSGLPRRCGELASKMLSRNCETRMSLA